MSACRCRRRRRISRASPARAALPVGAWRDRGRRHRRRPGDGSHRRESVVQAGRSVADAADDVEEQGRPRDRRAAVAARRRTRPGDKLPLHPQHPRRPGRRVEHVVPRHQSRLHVARLGRARAERARQHVVRRRAAARQHEGHRRRRLPGCDDRRRRGDRARASPIPNQLAVRGWSYGGILGGWTITQTTRFKAASLGAMVTDWASEYAMGFNHDVRLWYIGGTPWENPEALPPAVVLHAHRQGDDADAAAARRGGRHRHDRPEHDVLSGAQGSRRRRRASSASRASRTASASRITSACAMRRRSAG